MATKNAKATVMASIAGEEGGGIVLQPHLIKTTLVEVALHHPKFTNIIGHIMSEIST